MKKLYLLSILCLMTARIAFGMDHEKITGRKRGFIVAQEQIDSGKSAAVLSLESDIRRGDHSPRLLLKATHKLNDLLADATIAANNKKIWYNWIVTKANRMIQANASRAENEKLELGTLITSIETLTPSMLRLPTTSASIANLKTIV